MQFLWLKNRSNMNELFGITGFLNCVLFVFLGDKYFRGQKGILPR